MAGSSDKSGDKGPDRPAEPARPPEGVDALMNNPAATIAAATAFGLSMATQMSRFWLGSLQGAMEVTGQLARQLEEERKAADAVGRSPAEVEKETQVPATAVKSATEPKAEKSVTVKPKAAPAKAKPKVRQGDAMASVPDRSPSEASAPKKVSTSKKTGGKADDLKKIDGIGPKIEQLLKGRGIARFQDLVDLDDKALAALDAELGLDGRALRDDWTGQARRLVIGSAKSRKVRSGS